MKLVFKPYYNGVKLAIFFVLPCFAAYFGFHYFIKDDVIAFTSLCAVAALVAIWLFVKKPKLLSDDIAYIQKDLLAMLKKKKKKQQQPAVAVAADVDVDGIDKELD